MVNGILQSRLIENGIMFQLSVVFACQLLQTSDCRFQSVEIKKGQPSQAAPFDRPRDIAIQVNAE